MRRSEIFLFFAFLAIAPHLRDVHGEVYSSAANMKEIFKIERDMVHILESYSLKLQQRLNRIDEYMKVRTKLFSSSAKQEGSHGATGVGLKKIINSFEGRIKRK